LAFVHVGVVNAENAAEELERDIGGVVKEDGGMGEGYFSVANLEGAGAYCEADCVCAVMDGDAAGFAVPGDGVAEA